MRAEAELILSNGLLPQRKALLQELVAEIRVEGRGSITPVFRVPDPPVRVLDTVVGCSLRNANPGPVVVGPRIAL